MMVPPSSRPSAMIASKDSRARRASSASVASKQTVGWVLPSPAWAQTPMVRSYRVAISSTPSRSSARRERGTHTSSIIVVPLTASRATRDIRRAARRSSDSASVSAGTTPVAPAASQRAPTAARSAAGSGVSKAASSSASVVSGRPMRAIALTARTVVRSMSSSRDGVCPSAMIRQTASPAAAAEGNSAASASCLGGRGLRARTALTTTPRLPSEPTKSRVRSYPATPLAVRRPVVRRRPSARTTSRPRTYSAVTPYLTQHRPPEAVPMLPPMVQVSQEEGSGG
ncbi:hypothetical protein SF12_18555 [Streptomyces sp. MBRL 601]|nr:hypothetical protein SF12_18555 [Streptomyces sp. MBRL 601]